MTQVTPPRLVAYLRSLEIQAFKERATRFRSHNFEHMSPASITNAVLEVLLVNGQYAQTLCHTVYEPGTVFWRARSLNFETVPPLTNMRSIADAWEPPTRWAGAGRLNRAQEPLLYVAVNEPVGLHREARIPAGSFYALIKYEATKPINATVLQPGHPQDLDLDVESREKLLEVERFVNEELFRPVDDEYQYKVTEVITKSLFDIPAQLQQAWVYPSVLNPRRWNAAFRPADAHTCLRLIGVVGCRPPQGADEIEGVAFSSGRFQSGEFQWQAPGSALQAECFPEFD